MSTKKTKQIKKEIAVAKRQVGVYRTFGKLAFDRSRAVYLQAHSLKKHSKKEPVRPLHLPNSKILAIWRA